MTKPSKVEAPRPGSQEASEPSAVEEPPEATGRKLLPLAIGALGVVYGDIGTSPLYAVKECFTGAHAVAPTRDNVLGVLSLMFWLLVLVVTVKYLVFIMRADNKGEGGLLSLMALIPGKLDPWSARLKGGAVMLGLFGTALLYGDGVITPAISVLSAVEGLAVATTALERVVVPLTCLILFGLFVVQRRGTGGIGKIFGPMMVVWFVTLAGLGARYVLKNPTVLHALNPYWAMAFFQVHKAHAFVLLGSVLLVVTGSEALYADMGHFGKSAIRFSWGLVFPALVTNYFGQGALLLEQGVVENPFYALVPRFMLYPMVVLATVATVIASQAMISGAFSITRQAVQLGYCPRVTIVHTSSTLEGQVYIPEVNQALMVACIGLVLAFRSSSGLAAAYGIAVTGAFTITSFVFYVVATRTWKWPLFKALPLVVGFLAVDLGLFGSTLLKFEEGGWFPMALAAAVFTSMVTWKDGRAELAKRFAKNTMPLSNFLEDVAATQPHRVRGTAVFMSSAPMGTPPVLLHHLKHNQVLHQQVVVLSILSADEPVVSPESQLSVEQLGNGFYRVIAYFGFMQTPNVPEILSACRVQGLKAEPNTTSYFLGRETLLTTGHSKMMRWRKALFAFISRNARSATSYFGIPPGRVVELGMQVDL
ncbi:MAG: potassium transporter Kup [Myxococcota bacterium]